MSSLKFGLFFGLLLLANAVEAREWSSKNGQFRIEADAVAFSDHLVVLKKTNGALVAVELEQLSDADKEFVASKETVDATKKQLDELQTWTGKDGLKIRGRILGFEKRDLKVQRRLGAVQIDGKKFSEIDPLHQKLLLKILSNLEKTTLENEKQLEAWAKSLGGDPKSYPLEGVLMELESGDRIGVPFFLFSSQDLEVLQPGWELWQEKNASQQAQERESFLMRAAAAAYQRDQRQAQQQARQAQQIELLKLDMLAAATGVIDIWEVGLAPAAGNFGRPMTVMVPATNSAIASELALQKYPGYAIFGVRRASY